jgi:hypothetical protein
VLLFVDQELDPEDIILRTVRKELIS